MGARGSGKSTLALQYFKLNYRSPEECLYISVDNPLVLKRGFYSIAEEFFQYYGDTIIIDEVHKEENWSLYIKALYDSFPKKKIIISGSSMLNILNQKGDLSRRLLLYNLPVLSFREFLVMQVDKPIPIFSLQDILTRHTQISTDLLGQIPSILKYFRNYLQFGSFPFFKQHSSADYLSLLGNTLDKIIYEDIQTIRSLSNVSALKIKKLLAFLALSPIPTFNIETLKNEIEVSKDTLYEYIDLLERANVIQIIRTKSKSIRGIKNARIFFQSSNYYYSIAETFWKHTENRGNIRESFFASQLTYLHELYASRDLDFELRLEDKEIAIEIGGKNEKQTQIKNIENAYIFKDGIEIGAGRTVPLYLAGLLY